jgi:hypothetical protein
MNIYFDLRTYNYLNTYVLKPGNIELELRFGNYDKDGKFKPDIGLETFNKMNEYFNQIFVSDDSNKSIISKVEEDSNSEILPNHIRRIIYTESQKNDPQIRGKIKYEQKNKIYTGDIQYKDFVLRISESQERPVQPYQVQPIEVRERERTMYYHKSRVFYFVLTKVTSYEFSNQSKKFVTYELEIEYTIQPQLIRYLTDMFKDSVGLILSILINNKDKFRYSYIPLEEENRIRGL